MCNLANPRLSRRHLDDLRSMRPFPERDFMGVIAARFLRATIARKVTILRVADDPLRAYVNATPSDAGVPGPDVSDARYAAK
jgi:hypothetical protein